MKSKNLSVLFWIGWLLYLAYDLRGVYLNAVYIYGFTEAPELVEFDPEKLDAVVKDVMLNVLFCFSSIAIHSVMGVAFWLRGRE